MEFFGKYFDAMGKLGAAEYHIDILVKCLEEHFDPDTRDYTTIVARDQAKRFLSEIKAPPIEESLQKINENIEKIA